MPATQWPRLHSSVRRPGEPIAMTGEGKPTGFSLSAEDRRVVEALRHGDETVFLALVERYYATMRRLAAVYVDDPAVVEDVVQDAWLGALQGIHRFEGRSSFKTWLLRILTNIAKTRAQRERRSIAFSNLVSDDAEADEPAVEAERFLTSGRWVGHWAAAPSSWITVEDRLAAIETQTYVAQAIQTLSPHQRQVIILRDIEGLNADEVCNILGLTETNQRVLLHRARSKVRRALEQFINAA